MNVLDFSFPIIGLTETWLSDSTCDLFSIEGYEFIERHRNERVGGGVGFFIKNHLNFVCRDDMSQFDEFCECLCIEIDRRVFDMSRNVLVAVFYRPSNTDSRVFIEMLHNFLDIVKKEDKLCYIIGDYNINIMNYDIHPQTAEFVDLLYSYCFFPLINRPTRVTHVTATLIDNVFTNNLECVEKSLQGIFVTDISDHFPIFHINWSYQQEELDIYIIKRMYSYKHKQSFCSDLAKIDWSEIYNLIDAQSIFTRFHEIFLRLYNVNFPKRKIKLKYNNRKPWLTEGIKQSIRIKNKLYMNFVKVKSAYNETKYKTFRNKLKHVLLTAEKKHYAETLEANKSNMKKTWTILKGIINLNKRKRVQDKFKLHDDTLTENKVTISESFNQFFVNIGPNLAKGMSNQTTTPESFMGGKVSNLIFLEPVTIYEIQNLVMSLKNGAPGYDEIKSDILKLSLQHIGEPLAHMCNMSLIQGIFPQELKLANVLPLYKSGDPQLFSNYRPVSLLPTLSKVLEKVMYTRLNSLLEMNDILFGNQFGFRRSHSCYMALMIMVNEITRSLDNGEHVVGIFLDFSRAFDTVNHTVLLKKLYYYGIRGNALEWFESYLSGRQQYVTYNGYTSSTKYITCGVPQGSILGPLLFLIYINDLQKVCNLSTPILFADDKNLYYKSHDQSILEKQINDELRQVSLWLKVNKLSLNVSKTPYIIFTRKSNTVTSVDIRIEKQAINEVNKTKFLGVIIDKKLTWKEHISYLSSKISSGIGMIIKAKKRLNKDALVTLYYSFIYPYMTYCNHVWGTACITYLNKIIILQKKAIRIVCNVNRRTPTDPLFRELKIIPFLDVNIYSIAIFMFRYVNGSLPKPFVGYFTTNANINSYNTRQTLHFHLPNVRSDLGKQNIKYRGATIWNRLLDLGINLETSEFVFTKCLKYYIKSDVLISLRTMK